MDKLVPDSPKTLYQQLVTRLKTQIRNKEFKPGDKLPSIRKMTDKYDVSKITVIRALDELRQDQWIYSVQGKGYFVTENQIIKKVMPTQEGFTDSMMKEGLKPLSIVLKAEISRADNQMGKDFGIGVNDEMVVLERVRFGNEIPLCIQVSYLPHEVCRGILDFDFRNRSLYETLREEYQISMGKSRYCIQSGLAGERELYHLDLKHPSAVLWVLHWAYTSSGRLFEFGKTAYRSDYFQIHSPVSEFELITDISL